MIDSAGMEGLYGLEEVSVLAERQSQLVYIHGRLPVLGPMVETVVLANLVWPDPTSRDLDHKNRPSTF
jgi:hypothetical protein